MDMLLISAEHVTFWEKKTSDFLVRMAWSSKIVLKNHFSWWQEGYWYIHAVGKVQIRRSYTYPDVQSEMLKQN